MRIAQRVWSADQRADPGGAAAPDYAAQLVLTFGAPDLLSRDSYWTELRERWPTATLLAGSTAGEIYGTRVFDDTVTATAISFDHATTRAARVAIRGRGSDEIGRQLAEMLLGPELRHVLVLSDGLKVNGSALVRGLTERLPEGVTLTGGLCGDGARFGRTYACLDRFDAEESVVAVGFYGRELRVGMGSLGGWDSFGPERRITRSSGNVLYELDGEPALSLYERYLGEHAAGLPASGLLFPLTVRSEGQERPLVRTILAVDRDAGSMTFAGDVPEGQFARLMRANFDRLVDGAIGAARTSLCALGEQPAQLAILISCVGRKLVLKQRVEEEVEGVERVLGSSAALTGFYSYGELSPFTAEARCELHNQTMTITTLSER